MTIQTWGDNDPRGAKLISWALFGALLMQATDETLTYIDATSGYKPVRQAVRAEIERRKSL